MRKKKRIEFRPRLPRKPGWKDVSDEFWEKVEALLPKPKPRKKKAGRPPADRRKLLNGMLYVLRTGCQWKMIPKEYYAGSTTHRYFQKWVQARVFKKMWKACLQEYDELRGIRWDWQILDSQTVSAPVKKGKK
jgi:transposase